MKSITALAAVVVTGFPPKVEIVSPLKLALLDLFFIAVGMSMDLGILAHAGWIMIFRVIFIILLKAILLYFLARWFGFDRGDLFAPIDDYGRHRERRVWTASRGARPADDGAADLARFRPGPANRRHARTHFEEIRRRLPRCGCRKYNRSRDRATPGRLHG